MAIDELQVVLTKAGGAVLALIIFVWFRYILLHRGEK